MTTREYYVDLNLNPRGRGALPLLATMQVSYTDHLEPKKRRYITRYQVPDVCYTWYLVSEYKAVQQYHTAEVPRPNVGVLVYNRQGHPSGLSSDTSTAIYWLNVTRD